MMNDKECIRARGLLVTAARNFMNAGDILGDGDELDALPMLLSAIIRTEDAIEMLLKSNDLSWHEAARMYPTLCEQLSMAKVPPCGTSGYLSRSLTQTRRR